MSAALVQQRCLHHPDREAAYRCPGCKRHYCRECGAEHDGRMLCATCLKNLPSEAGARSGMAMRLGATASPVIGLFIAWVFFYYVGQLLMLIPAEFHEGRLP